MKNFFGKNKIILGAALILIALFVLGNVFSNHMIKARLVEVEDDATRYYDLVDLTNLEYNFDTETLGHKTYIATFTYESETYKAFLDNSFTYVEMIEGDGLDLIIMAAVKHHAEEENLLQNKAYLASFDNATKTLVINVAGFAGKDSISVAFVLNEDLNGVESYTVTSTETYTNEYNEAYTNGPVPYVEETIIDLYLNDQAYAFDTVGGASAGTGDAVVQLLSLLDLFFDSVEGGNSNE